MTNFTETLTLHLYPSPTFLKLSVLFNGIGGEKTIHYTGPLEKELEVWI